MTAHSLKPLATAILLLALLGLACTSSATMRGPGDGTSPSRHTQQPRPESTSNTPTSAAAATLYGYVSLYQKIFSTLKWSNCQFSPSCSHYAQEALEKYGAIAGISMAGDRLIRCNRWAWDSGHYERLSDGHLHDPLTDQLLWADK